MITLRKAEERGHTDWGWLDSRHTFSFGEYHDPAHHHFRTLRVINEDWVQPGKGFGTHPHRDMEILTYVLSGALQHKDSMGNGSVIQAGEFQRMTAGTGITHSEFNASNTEDVHLLQIWLFPDEKGLEPEYEQRQFAIHESPNKWVLMASPDGLDQSLRMHQDALLYAAAITNAGELNYQLDPSHGAWLQVMKGDVTLNGHSLKQGDGAQIEEEEHIRVQAQPEAEVLLFDLA